MNNHLNKLILLLTTSALIILMFFTYTRGTLISDEGWIVSPAARILLGEIPYKEFHFIYTPGTAYVTALSLFIFGDSIFSSRILVIITSLLSILLISLISKQLKLQNTATIIALSLFVIFAPLHVNFSWPVMYTNFLILLNILFLLIGERKNKFRFYFFSGVTVALVIFFKQNFGLAAFISTSISICFLVKSERFKKFIFMLSGLILSLSVWGLYMFSTNSFIPFLQDFYLFMVDQTLLNHLQATPFIYPAPLFEQILKTIFYLFPLLISLFSIYILRKTKHYLIIPIFVLMVYLFGIRPTTDYTHLVPLLSLIGLPMGIIYTFSKTKLIKILIIIFGLLFILLGLYTAYYRGYYKWNPPLLENTYKVNNPKINVSVSSDVATTVEALTPYVTKLTQNGDYIFVYRYSPLFYFMFDRRNPTKFEFAPINILTTKDQQEIISNLTKKNVKLIITDFNIRQEDSLIAHYIVNSYKSLTSVKDYTLWYKTSLKLY